MIAFFDKDVSVLNSLRNKLQTSISYLWLFIYFDINLALGIKIVIANEFDGQLSKSKTEEVLVVLKSFCEENALEFVYENVVRKL